jgi:hypothetical protein
MLMKTHNPQNERIKRTYFTYLAEAKGFSEATLDAVAKALNRFETYTKFRDFKAFHIEQAKGFKASLAEQMSARTKDRLSKTGEPVKDGMRGLVAVERGREIALFDEHVADVVMRDGEARCQPAFPGSALASRSLMASEAWQLSSAAGRLP